MNDQVVVTWGIHDGYAGNRPQETRIDKADLEGLTDEGQWELIEDYVRQDMMALGFYISEVDWCED